MSTISVYLSTRLSTWQPSLSTCQPSLSTCQLSLSTCQPVFLPVNLPFYLSVYPLTCCYVPQELQNNSPHYPQEVAMKERNRTKNRFVNILPCEWVISSLSVVEFGLQTKWTDPFSTIAHSHFGLQTKRTDPDYFHHRPLPLWSSD